METAENYNDPLKIICLTEESVETLFEIGVGQQIIGVSAFVKRPKEALSLPKVSFFTSSNIDKIVDMNADLILGFSDIQKDIARDLIERGQDVWIANHRSIDGIIRYIKHLSLLVDRKDEGLILIERINKKINHALEYAKTLKVRPKIYFEEWDDPIISSIQWVSELIQLVGGENIFADRSYGVLAKERFVHHEEIVALKPDIILACHCGKKVKINKIHERFKNQNIPAVENNHIYELEPEIFLQPGPAPLLDGLDILIELIEKWRLSL